MGNIFGSKPKTEIITPEAPYIPNQDELNAVAAARIGAGSPWTNSGYRAMDFLQPIQSVGNYLPQFPAGGFEPRLTHPYVGPNQSSPILTHPYVGPNQSSPILGNWFQPHPGLSQGPYQPNPWLAQLGGFLSQLWHYQQQQNQPNYVGNGLPPLQGSQDPLIRQSPQPGPTSKET